MKLDLTYQIKNVQNTHKPAFDIHAYVTSSDSQTDVRVFMIQIGPKNYLGEPTDRFSHVADLVDMQDYPSQRDQDMAYYRTDDIILRVRSQFICDQTVQALIQEVKDLVQTSNALQEAQTQSTTTISFS